MNTAITTEPPPPAAPPLRHDPAGRAWLCVNGECQEFVVEVDAAGESKCPGCVERDAEIDRLTKTADDALQQWSKYQEECATFRAELAALRERVSKAMTLCPCDDSCCPMCKALFENVVAQYDSKPALRERGAVTSEMVYTAYAEVQPNRSIVDWGQAMADHINAARGTEDIAELREWKATAERLLATCRELGWGKPNGIVDSCDFIRALAARVVK